LARITELAHPNHGVPLKMDVKAIGANGDGDMGDDEVMLMILVGVREN